MKRAPSLFWLLVAMGFLSCGSGTLGCSCGHAAPMRIETDMSVACPGSQVSVTWNNPKQRQFTLRAPDGTQLYSGSAVTGVATFIASTPGAVTALTSDNQRVSLALEVVHNNVRTLGLVASASCTTSNGIYGISGTYHLATSVYDPRLQVNHIEVVGRAGLQARHLGTTWWATPGIDVVPKVALGGDDWFFFSPLADDETCTSGPIYPQRSPPSAIAVDLRAQCTP